MSAEVVYRGYRPTYRTICLIYSMVIAQPYGLIHWQVVLCGIDLKTGLISRKLHKRSGIGLRLYHIRLSSLTIFIVTVSAAGDLQASGKRQ